MSDLLKASDAHISEQTGTNPAAWVGLPVERFEHRKAGKLKRAQHITDWIVKTMTRENAQVGVVSRKGSFLTVLYDYTGMTHSGFVFQHPETGEWITYSLYSNPKQNHKNGHLIQQSLLDYYYTQNSLQEEALLLLPDAALQTTLKTQLLETRTDTLLPSDEHFNLVAPLDSPTAFNCTKWTLLNLMAAKYHTQDLLTLIQLALTHHAIPTIHADPLTRWVIGLKPDVNLSDLNPSDRVRTVTVNSFYQSPLFTKRYLYSGRTLPHQNFKTT